MKFISKNVSETESLAKRMAARVKAPAIICLIGELGAGKTAFTRGFCSYFGIEKGVASPTFTILMRYRGNDIDINHFDLYRTDDYDELCDIGFEDQIDEGITLIEWPDKFMEYLPHDRITVNINYTPIEGEREITVEGIEF